MELRRSLLLLIAAHFLQCATATTEWFGDLRAHLNPAKAPAFYDVTYDETECPLGLQSNAIPDYVYFGEMLQTIRVREYTECLQKCITTEKCLAVNYFESLNEKERSFCELLSETQYDNPRLMRPFRRAVYYEKIRCRNEADLGEDQPELPPQQKGEDAQPGGGDSASAASATPNADAKDAAILLQRQQQQDQQRDAEAAAILKKLEAKVREFNMRFRS